MQQNSNNETDVTYLIGSRDIVMGMSRQSVDEPFNERVIEFLASVSKELLADRESKQYTDVVTFAFWIRKAALAKLKEQYEQRDYGLRLGRGVIFHIAPSNVPVNYAYSLVSGMLTGNSNIVRVPSKDYPQVTIINRAFKKVLLQNDSEYEDMVSKLAVVRYGHLKEANDFFSGMCDVRVVWGGDETIAQLRMSPLLPRTTEIVFADRFSLAVIDADEYLKVDDKNRVASDFYNDTYLTDQNACTSPRLVVWMGQSKEKAQELFWEYLYRKVEKEYVFQDIQGVDKLSQAYIAAATYNACEDKNVKVRVIPHKDNLLVRVKLSGIPDDLMDYRGNSGYFYEYDCDDIMDIRNLCDDRHCQTVSYIGQTDEVKRLAQSGIHGIDRIVPVGRTMDFELIWDGYDLVERMTRQVGIR